MNKVLGFIFILVIFNVQSVHSEDCYYIDCEGSIGYVFIPRAVIYSSVYSSNTLRRGDVQYNVVGLDELLFKSKGLPDVNSIQEIANDRTSFYWYEHISTIAPYVDQYKEYSLDEEKKIARLVPFQHRSFLMEKGSKVKILGYRHFPDKGLEDKLFAQIMFVSGPASNK